MRKVFKDLWRQHRVKIIVFTILRLISYIQVLFWAYAFAKVVNIMTNSPERWREAMVWAVAMVANKVTEDFVRVKAKYELEKIGVRIQVSLSSFFSRKTELKDGKRTGETVQAIKRAAEHIDELLDFYREDLLQLPVNFIIIPIILYRASPIYLLFLAVYVVLYLIINQVMQTAYFKRLRKSFRAAEIFWGTTYRKVPEVWRQREDGYAFSKEISKEGDELYNKETSANNINMWRWAVLMSMSSAVRGGLIVFVLYNVVGGITPLGNLILVSSYFLETQNTLNIVTWAIDKATRSRLAFTRLGKALKVSEED
jgi:ABC-type multidrug transport system fused ATPase/permease subunit